MASHAGAERPSTQRHRLSPFHARLFPELRRARKAIRQGVARKVQRGMAASALIDPWGAGNLRYHPLFLEVYYDGPVSRSDRCVHCSCELISSGCDCRRFFPRRSEIGIVQEKAVVHLVEILKDVRSEEHTSEL